MFWEHKAKLDRTSKRNNWGKVIINGSIPSEYYENVDLSGANLQGLDARGIPFSNVILQNTNLKESSFYRCSLSHVDLRKSALDNARFIESTISESSMEQSSLYKLQLRNTDIKYSVFSHANIRESQIVGSAFTNTHFEGADLEKSQIDSNELRCANFKKANLAHSIISRSNIDGADFSFANLERSAISATIWDKANFKGASCIGMYFSHSSLNEPKPDPRRASGFDVLQFEIKYKIPAFDANYIGATNIPDGLALGINTPEKLLERMNKANNEDVHSKALCAKMAVDTLFHHLQYPSSRILTPAQEILFERHINRALENKEVKTLVDQWAVKAIDANTGPETSQQYSALKTIGRQDSKILRGGVSNRRGYESLII